MTRRDELILIFTGLLLICLCVVLGLLIKSDSEFISTFELDKDNIFKQLSK